MSTFEKLKLVFDEVAGDFAVSPAILKLGSAEGKAIAYYKEYLRQVYHYTKDNPQIQALASVYFRGSDRDLVRPFLSHAMSEIGHDLLALKDLEALGENVDDIPFQNPLPSTVALNSFAFCQIYNRNAVGYLGYLMFLEFLPTASGRSYIEKLERLGVPRNAMSFIEEHAAVDVRHNKLMENYAERIIQNTADLDAVVFAMKVTGRLYSDMLMNAFDQVDNPKDWGFSTEELVRRLPVRVIAEV